MMRERCTALARKSAPMEGRMAVTPETRNGAKRLHIHKPSSKVPKPGGSEERKVSFWGGTSRMSSPLGKNIL